MTTKPDAVEDNHLAYLDALRRSGATNMFGAVPYLERTFPDLTGAQAREVLAYWMRTFSERHQINASDAISGGQVQG